MTSTPHHPEPGNTATEAAPSSILRQERSVLLCLLMDVLTFIPVITIAVLSGSMLLLSDLMDYAKGFVADGVALHILREIRRGHMRNYDYGPGKVEQLGALLGAVCFVAGLLALAAMSFYRLYHPIELDIGFTAMGMAIQAAGFFLNAWLWFKSKRLARETASPLIDMQWRNRRTDALACLAVLVALAFTLLFRHTSWEEYIDPLCALAYVFFAIGTYVTSIRNILRDLLDHTLPEELQLTILRRLAQHYDGYEAFHGVRSRRAGNRIYITLSLSFNPDKRVGEAVDTIASLCRAIEADIPMSEATVVLKPLLIDHLAREERTNIQILPLSPATLEEAIALIESTFKLRPDEMPRQELEESLWPGKHTAALARIGISDPRYWVAFHHHKVVGVAGLTYRPDDRHEAVWGGWAVYANEAREGLSRARFLMLRKLAIEASATGRRYFRLETSTDPVSKQANRFYDRAGLTVYRTEDRNPGDFTILYRQMEIQKAIHLFATGKNEVQHE